MSRPVFDRGSGAGRRPRLTFFCELEAGPLQALFADRTAVAHLRALDAAVSVGLIDLSAGRAAVVRELNAAGIPLVAWLLLPRERGYWLNAGNAPQAAARYEEFRAWTAEHGLRWAGVALDIETDIHLMDDLAARRLGRVPGVLWRALDGGRLRRAEASYGTLAARIRADGYRLDVYQFPIIVDERRAGSTLLRRLGGLVDVPADREVLMLYSSFMRPYGAAVLWSYTPDAQSIGIGSTGGGTGLGGPLGPSPLTWVELARDLRLAAHRCRDLHIFSLEGAVRQGFLPRLAGFNWDGPASPPLGSAAVVDRLRQAAQAALWTTAHGPALAAAATAAWLLARALRRRVKAL